MNVVAEASRHVKEQSLCSRVLKYLQELAGTTVLIIPHESS